jgi:hypothetical protein
MRTKTLLLSAAVGLAGIASSMAQAVYSVNYVGYVNKSLAAGVNIIANPLNNGNNQVQTLFTTANEGDTIYRYNGVGYDQASFLFGSWISGGDLVLAPGEGFFYISAAAATVTFVGEGMEGPNLQNPIPGGLSMRASKIPQAGDLAAGGSLEFPQPSEGDTVYKWLTSGPGSPGYDQYTYLFGSWLPSAPAVGVAEGFWYIAVAPLSWTRQFEVTP